MLNGQPKNQNPQRKVPKNKEETEEESIKEIEEEDDEEQEAEYEEEQEAEYEEEQEAEYEEDEESVEEQPVIVPRRQSVLQQRWLDTKEPSKPKEENAKNDHSDFRNSLKARLQALTHRNRP